MITKTPKIDFTKYLSEIEEDKSEKAKIVDAFFIKYSNEVAFLTEVSYITNFSQNALLTKSVVNMNNYRTKLVKESDIHNSIYNILYFKEFIEYFLCLDEENVIFNKVAFEVYQAKVIYSRISITKEERKRKELESKTALVFYEKCEIIYKELCKMIDVYLPTEYKNK